MINADVFLFASNENKTKLALKRLGWSKSFLLAEVPGSASGRLESLFVDP